MNCLPRSLWPVGVLLIASLLTACGSAQSRKAHYIAHGEQYFAAGNYDKARVEFSNAAQIDPKDPEVRYLLGQVAERMGDVRGAAGQYQAAIDDDPHQAKARAALGRIYLYAGLPDKALELVEPGLAAAPSDAALLTVRGAARAQLGDVPAGMKDAQQARQLAPTDSYTIALVASLYRRRGDLDQANAVVQAGLQRLPRNVDLRTILADLQLADHQPAEAEAQLKQIITLEPKVLLHRYQLARFYVQQKNIDAAQQTLHDAVGLFPASIDAKLQWVTFLATQRGRDQASAQAKQFLDQEPNNDAVQLAFGQFLAQLGQADAAERAFRTVMVRAGDKPDGLTARDRLAALLVAKHDVAGASALIAQVLRQNPRDNDALVIRANLAMGRGDVPGAIADLRSVLRDQPNALAVMRMLARAYEVSGETDQAEETLRAAVQAAPRDLQSRLELAQVLIGTNKADQAETLLEQLDKDSPNNAPVLQTLYRSQLAQKQYAQARTTAQSIERASPREAIGYYLEGLVDEADQQASAAAKDFEQALQRQPGASEPLTELTRLTVRAKQPDAAIARLDDVIKQFPADPAALHLKAEVLLSKGQAAAALPVYQQTLQLAPHWARSYDGLAGAQMLLKHSDEAIHTLQLGVVNVPTDTTLLLELGRLYEQMGRADDAIALYRQVLTKTPNYSFAANNLAMLLVTYKHDPASLAEAQKLADQLTSLSVADVMDTRGWVKFKSGDFRAAESLLQQAVDKAPNTPELRYHLGMAQLRSGEPQAAQQSLESALHSTAKFPGMDEARATLAQLEKSPAAG